MVDFLIKLVARRIAGRIDRGSRAGALIGAVWFAAAGAGIGWALWKFQVVAFFGPAIILSLALLGALGGALIGAGARSPAASPAAAPSPRNDFVPVRTPFFRVRVTNWNVALGKLVVSLLLLALSIAMGVVLLRERSRELGTAAADAGCFALGIVAAAQFLRSPLWLDIDRAIVVRRPLGQRLYQPEEIEGWGFLAAPGRLTHEPPQNSTPFFIQFTDGFRFQVTTSPSLSARIAEALARLDSAVE